MNVTEYVDGMFNRHWRVWVRHHGTWRSVYDTGSRAYAIRLAGAYTRTGGTAIVRHIEEGMP
jgi:hypothetical protein